jgi:hypothetical protein
MGKIGDLFVRLGLKSDGFKKGMQEAKKETQDFGSKLGQLKAGALAVWAAIGAGVTKIAMDIAHSTNQMGDMWAQRMSSMKASYHSLISEMSAKSKDSKGGFLRFFNLTDTSANQKLGANAKAAGEAAAEMVKAFDAEFELLNSVKLQKQAVQQELNDLYTKMRDTTLSNADRQAAADRYKAILQPIADAEVATYSNMMQMAMKAWQAGTDLEREYSTEEMTEFFSKIGTEYDKMAEKFPDLMRVYETRKGDENNQLIFDIVSKYQQAANQMSDVDRQLSRTTNAIKAKTVAELKAIAEDIKKMGKEDLKMDLELDVELDWEKEDIQDLYDAIEQDTAHIVESMKAKVDEVIALNKMLEDSIIGAISGGLQAITDLAFGIEGADWKGIVAGLLQPFAQTATQLGEMLVAQGIAIGAFKESLKSLQPGVAIAAGLSLIAVGAAISSGIQALSGGPRGATSASTGAGTTSAGGIETYEQEITVHVVGEISGNNIVLAGQKTLNKWNR